MAFNTIASSDKLKCTDYVDFGKCQGQYGQYFRSKCGDPNYLDVEYK